ncbi:hypothetical protein BDV25DRAFT_141709 [Aspergillus avenaceus]|uniref:Protein kinase domain-containing protein n=1 Tax=Aspergillus avenaceus TaxID=36643 RepID=A0A5N6TQW2_ASPAV|nr:hypothetical protein BDV25DRAFT_141709 [Aspergillus avenaceus]
MSVSKQSWPEFFFSGAPHIKSNSDRFQHFPCDNWKVGERVSRDIPLGRPILVQWLYAKENDIEFVYVAKSFPEYPEHEALVRLQRIPSERHSLEDLKYELDRLLKEARAHERISRFCPVSRKIYFPQYYGVLTDIPRSHFPDRYQLRPRAVVLEAIRPYPASWRILAAERLLGVVQNFGTRLKHLPLSQFEVEWYQSLFDNRLRRVNTLYNIGITHGDVRDEHFRMPGDFYDSVLYDFSNAYTFSPSWSYSVNCGTPRPLSCIRQSEQRQIEDQIYQRAEQMDLRDHFANQYRVSPSVI